MLTYPGEEHAARHQGFVGLRWRMCIWHNNALTLLGMLHSLQSFRFFQSRKECFLEHLAHNRDLTMGDCPHTVRVSRCSVARQHSNPQRYWHWYVDEQITSERSTQKS